MQDQCEQVRPISRDNTCAPVLSGSNLDLGLVSLHSHSWYIIIMVEVDLDLHAFFLSVQKKNR